MTDIKHFNQVDLSRRLGVSCRTLERWRWLGLGPNVNGGMKVYRLGGAKVYQLAQGNGFRD